jgi:zinc transport system ATP-binding protein
MENSAIEITNLTVKFNHFVALENINLSIPKGKFIAILGPNGSGKSTLLRTILGVITPTGGNITIFGTKNSNIKPEMIGYVPQMKTLDKFFPAIGLELVLSGIVHKWSKKLKLENKNKVMEIIEQLGATSFVNKPLNQLSGGQLQRLYLARALVHKPQIILLDEPATGVDFVCETNLNSIINSYSTLHSTTVLMVTHDLTSAYHHTEDIILLNKNLVFYGDKNEAFTDENLKHTFSHYGDKHNVVFNLHQNV